MKDERYFDKRVIGANKDLFILPGEQVINKLKKIVGQDNVLTSEADRRIYARDFWPLLTLRVSFNQELLLPGAVVLPASSQEVSTLLKYLQTVDVPVIPFGGGSGVLGGVSPFSGGVVIDTKRLDRVIEINDSSLTVTVEAGILGIDLEDALNRAGFTLGHFPQSIDTATLGGLIATRSSGQFSTKYGNIENMLLAVEAVLPGGTLIQTKKSKARSSTGPDLACFFAGSEGSFGIITEATLRIHPYPEKRSSESFVSADFDEGLEAIRLILRKGICPAVIRLYDEHESLYNFGSFIKNDQKVLLFVMEGYGPLVDIGTADDCENLP